MLPYQRAQIGMAQLKAAVFELLQNVPDGGLSNAQVGRSLGIYSGHAGHEGHISRTLLSMLEQEGVARQDPGTKRWVLRRHTTEAVED